MPLQCGNQIWQSLEEGAGKRCWECGVVVVDCFYVTPFSSTRKQTHFALVVCALCQAFLNGHRSGVLTALYLVVT